MDIKVLKYKLLERAFKVGLTNEGLEDWIRVQISNYDE